MKNILIVGLVLSWTLTAISQDKTLLVNTTKHQRILTLSNGKYEELFDGQDIQQIGNALVNIQTMKVVKLLSDTESQRRLDNSSSSRFLSVDPATASFPMLTPYQYASNRPIDGVDLDGKEWAENSKIGIFGGGLQLQTTFALKVKVENQSTIVTDANAIKKAAELYKNAVENKYKQNITLSLFGIPFKVAFATNVILDYSPEPPPADREKMGILIFDDRKSTVTGTDVTTQGDVTTTRTSFVSTPGITSGEPVNDFVTRIGITMDGKPVGKADMSQTDEHEAGHSGGLNHPWEFNTLEQSMVLLQKLNQKNAKSADANTIKTNVMNSDGNTNPKYRSNGGESLLLGQLFMLLKNIQSRSVFSIDELEAKPATGDTPASNNQPSKTNN